MSVTIDKTMSVSIKRHDMESIEIFYPGWTLFRYGKKYSVKDGIVCYVTANKIHFDVATEEMIKSLESEGFKREQFELPLSRERTPMYNDDIAPKWRDLLMRAEKICR